VISALLALVMTQQPFQSGSKAKFRNPDAETAGLQKGM